MTIANGKAMRSGWQSDLIVRRNARIRSQNQSQCPLIACKCFISPEPRNWIVCPESLAIRDAKYLRHAGGLANRDRLVPASETAHDGDLRTWHAKLFGDEFLQMKIGLPVNWRSGN